MIKKPLRFSAFLFALTLPISTKAGNVTLCLFLICSLYALFKEKKKISVPNKKYYLYTTLFVYILVFIGLFVTEDKVNTIVRFERDCIFLLLPVIVGFLSLSELKEIKKSSFYGLSLGVGIGSIFLLVNDFMKYFLKEENFIISEKLLGYNYTYHEFTKIIDIHPSYFGMYVILVLVFLSSQFYNSNLLIRRIAYILFPILLLTVLFLNSRSILFLSTVLVLILLNNFFSKIYKTSSFMFYGGLLGVVLFFIFFLEMTKETYFFWRITEQLKWELSVEVDSKYGDLNVRGDSRMARWKVILGLIKKNPYGYGTGTEQRVLYDAYLKNNLISSAERRYDSHNQYLSFILEYGVFGLVLFLLFLFGNIYYSFKNQDYIGLCFFFTVLFVSSFDNTFKLNSGIIFIAFFSNIFLFSNVKK